jgi:hypothetical protein
MKFYQRRGPLQTTFLRLSEKLVDGATEARETVHLPN